MHRENGLTIRPVNRFTEHGALVIRERAR
jgi:hypothetical protein